MRRFLEWTTTPPTKSNASGGGYKEKFEKLLDYHKNHKAYFIVRSEIKYIRDDGFHYMDRVKHAGEEFDHDVLVRIQINKLTKQPDWWISVFKDGNHVLDKSHYGTGYESLVNSLRDSLVIPPRGSSDYENLLESAWQLSEDLSNYDVKKEGSSLAAYIDGKLIARGQNYSELAADVREWEQDEGAKLSKSRFSVTWIVDANNRVGYIEDLDNSVVAENEQEAIKYIKNKVPMARNIKATKLEAVDTTFADDFLLYENLWN
jgi:hypothetical protein